jgi:hypothetical protein
MQSQTNYGDADQIAFRASKTVRTTSFAVYLQTSAQSKPFVQTIAEQVINDYARLS